MSFLGTLFHGFYQLEPSTCIWSLVVLRNDDVCRYLMQSEMEPRVSFAHSMDRYPGWQEFWPLSSLVSTCSASLHQSKMLLDLRSEQSFLKDQNMNSNYANMGCLKCRKINYIYE